VEKEIIVAYLNLLNTKTKNENCLQLPNLNGKVQIVDVELIFLQQQKYDMVLNDNLSVMCENIFDLTVLVCPTLVPLRFSALRTTDCTWCVYVVLMKERKIYFYDPYQSQNETSWWLWTGSAIKRFIERQGKINSIAPRLWMSFRLISGTVKCLKSRFTPDSGVYILIFVELLLSKIGTSFSFDNFKVNHFRQHVAICLKKGCIPSINDCTLLEVANILATLFEG
jgi:hypothetical protein